MMNLQGSQKAAINDHSRQFNRLSKSRFGFKKNMPDLVTNPYSLHQTLEQYE